MKIQDLHPDVLKIGREFSAVGLPTPTAIENKGAALLTPNFRGERVAAVVADVIRCSSTLVASLAAGAVGVIIDAKGADATNTAEHAEIAAGALGVPIALGGELHGRPIAGGVIGNSPRQAMPELLGGKLLRFKTTNFGASFVRLDALRRTFILAGGLLDIFVASFANVRRIATSVRAGSYNRVFIATGGFYDGTSIEDHVFGGDLLDHLAIPRTEMDDDCRTMLACAHEYRTVKERVDVFSENWIGRCLSHFHMQADIRAVVTGEGLDPRVRARLSQLTPMVTLIRGVSVITDGHSNQSRRKQFQLSQTSI